LGELDETSGMHFFNAFIPESDPSLAIALRQIKLAPSNPEEAIAMMKK
jgi:hypothetical protein